MSAPTFPSLLAGETRAGIADYLSTTFALEDAPARDALRRFLLDEQTGIFRGPYLKIRTPYLPVGADWVSPLGWTPSGFRPFQHQAEAFARLSTRDGAARPTIVTTGTGSGKTEAFLVPILDHARRAAERGERGIKAIILYPMNALVTDQARRIADYLHDDPRLAKVTAGVYIGGAGKNKTLTREHLVDDRDELRRDPPDILLTNYKMLDLLLLREDDNPLWAGAAATLQFLVLDEFHTYDGAQGTDVAMLIRRLGARAGVAAGSQPLGRVTPVATSATLGGGSRDHELRTFAETIFGTPFAPESLIGETALSAEELVPQLNFDLGVPTIDAVNAAPMPESDVPGSWDPLARVFLAAEHGGGTEGDSSSGDSADGDFTDPVELGALLSQHVLTRAVVTALGGAPLALAEATDQTVNGGNGIPQWGREHTPRPKEVQEALLRFLALLSVARVHENGRTRPLVNVQVQLWVRELTRMLRQVDHEPAFGWWHDGHSAETDRALPAAHCRVCGSSGWVAVTTELGDSLGHDPVAIWRSSVKPGERGKTRTLFRAHEDEDGVQFLDPETLELGREPGDGLIAVHVSADAEAAANQVCPSCGAANAVRFLGSSVATLLSVGITQQFGSAELADDEKKTLVFTDSVQDAAHRAAFIEGRAFAFNFRSAVLRALGEEAAPLSAVIGRLSETTDLAELYAITPPDFTRRLGYHGDWLKTDPQKRRWKLLATRIAFQATQELGHNARIGRTLELTGTVAVDYAVDLDQVATRMREAHQNLPQLSLDLGTAITDHDYRVWAFGVLDNLRTRGGVHHRWLDRYLTDDGKRWAIWGGAPDGMPQYPRGRSAPGFITTGQATDTEFASVSPRGESWLTDWTRRVLAVEPGEARALLAALVGLLAGAAADGTVGPLERRTSRTDAAVYGLRPSHVIIDPADPLRLACDTCQHVQSATVSTAELLTGSHCPRMRCAGALAEVDHSGPNFYRDLYRSRKIRRIVSQEHTGLLGREEREEVERSFKSGAAPTDPNILACTPTLELGIDIGDLSTVALASLPRSTASYLQRVGRAGRSTGNSFVLAAVPSSPRDLYYFAQPHALLAGEVLPPGAYLDATELLLRQFFAYCLDRSAAGELDVAAARPQQLAQIFDDGMADGAWLRQAADQITERGAELADGFLGLYRGLTADAKAAVAAYAAGGLRIALAEANTAWAAETAAVNTRINDLGAVISALDAQGHLGDTEIEDRKRCLGEQKGLIDQLRERNAQNGLVGLGGVGLLPNYNLLDDATELDVRLWWISTDKADPEPQSLELSYSRSTRSAITELAPGAFFYASGKRVEVDAVEVGPVSEPAWALRRMCPGCGWSSDDITQGASSCPRCGGTAVSDRGSVHKVLPLKRVSAVHRLDDVLIDEDIDDRTKTFFHTVTAVDVDPADVRSAWKLKDVVFGAEYVGRAAVRTFNLGLADAPGAAVDIAGETISAARFRTCVYCGVSPRPGLPEDRIRHRGYCATRRSTDPKWEELLLSHELVTQAVRLLLPVSMMRLDTVMVSFKGALLLGLRADFGGDPQHLDIVRSTMSDADGAARQFLVLHDMVPGGTGYLDRFGEPDRLRAILTQAQALLDACPCRLDGHDGCHRCLYGVLSPREIQHASRLSALKSLGEILGRWDVEVVDTVADVDIAPVKLSELELTFAEGLKAWLTAADGHSHSVAVGPQGEELEIRLPGPGGAGVTWRMRPQQATVAAGAIRTTPDFTFTRVDEQDAEVALYLDGREFHASVAHNRTDDDARKRDALRRDRRRVWSATWDDVEEFVSADGKKRLPELLDRKQQNGIDDAAEQPQMRVAWGNPIRFLLEYLRDPGSPVWEGAAVATVRALLTQPSAVPPITVAPAAYPKSLRQWAEGVTPAAPAAPAAPDASVMSVLRSGASGLPLFISVRIDDLSATIDTLGVLTALDDREEHVGGGAHGRQWQDWLRWSNLLQFLTLPRHGHPRPARMAEMWSLRSLDGLSAGYLPLSNPALLQPAAADPLDTASAAWQEAAEYGEAALRGLMRTLVDGEVAAPVIGYEVAFDTNPEWQAELAWPEQQVAVLYGGVDDAECEQWLRGQGWTVERFDSDRIAEIATAVRSRLSKND